MSDTIDDEAAIAYAAFPGAGRVSETSSSFDRAKEAIRAACAAFDDKGGDFERVTRELLGEFGFFNLRRQLAGQQFGRDLSGMLEEPGAEASRWYFECKNLRDVISTGEVAPKLIWHLSAELLSGGFVIVGPGMLSNEVHELLARTEFPFSVFDWTGDNFVKLVGVCPETRERWFPALSPYWATEEAATWRAHLLTTERAGYEMANPLRFFVRRHFPNPAQYAYFERDGHFEKWETEVSFVHVLFLSNVAKWPIVVSSIRVRTLACEPLPRRLLVHEKALGVLEPLRLKYAPSPSEDGCVELLGETMRSLHSRETEPFLLEMTPPPPPGLYDLQIEVTYVGNGRSWTSEAARLQVCVLGRALEEIGSDPENRLRLWVVQKHYHRAARRVLSLPPETWARINEAYPGGAGLVADDRSRLAGEEPHWHIVGAPTTNVLEDLGPIPGEVPARNLVFDFIEKDNFYKSCADEAVDDSAGAERESPR